MFSLTKRNDDGNASLISAIVLTPLVCSILIISISISLQLSEKPMIQDAAKVTMPEIAKAIDSLKAKSGGVIAPMNIEPNKKSHTVVVSYGSENMTIPDGSKKLDKAIFDVASSEDGSYSVTVSSLPFSIPLFMPANKNVKGEVIASYVSDAHEKQNEKKEK